MRRLTATVTIIAIVIAFTALCISAVVYCNGNPQAAICQSECDEDDWEEGDSDCEGLTGPNSVDTDVDSDDYDFKKPKPVQPKQNTSNRVRK